MKTVMEYCYEPEMEEVVLITYITTKIEVCLVLCLMESVLLILT